MSVWSEDGAATDAAEAASVLGRILTNMGRFDEAQVLLEGALATFHAGGDEIEDLKAEGRLAYLVLVRGDASSAVKRLESALRRAEGSEGLASLTATLQRVYGAALVECGRPEDAQVALQQALALARSSDGNVDLKSTEYEIGQTYRALARLPGVPAEEATQYAARGLAILEPFGVIVD